MDEDFDLEPPADAIEIAEVIEPLTLTEVHVPLALVAEFGVPAEALLMRAIARRLEEAHRAGAPVVLHDVTIKYVYEPHPAIIGHLYTGPTIH